MEQCQNVFGCKRIKDRVEENVEGEEKGNERRPIGHIGKRCWYLTILMSFFLGLLPYIRFYVKIHIFVRFDGSEHQFSNALTLCAT